jgi:transcription elongation factor Elf1
MSKNVYISADYSENDGDRIVVEELCKWGKDDLHKVEYKDMAAVASGSVSKDPDCRACDLKAEFNRQINASSVVIFIVGNKTATRTAGNSCRRSNGSSLCSCTPYKQNVNGSTTCKILGLTYTPGDDEDVGKINNYSYLRHEFEQAKKKGKPIIILYNSLRKELGWLPSYMVGYEYCAYPFWIYNNKGEKVGNYSYIKKVLGYE